MRHGLFLSALVATALTVTSAMATSNVVNTPLGSPRTVTVGELLGRTPEEVQTILSPEAKGWPITFALEAGVTPKTWAVAQASDLLQDLATVEFMARSRQDADTPLTPHASCQVSTTVGAATLMLLVFEHGQVVSVWDGEPTTPVDPAGLSADEALQRDGRTRLKPTEERVVSCQRITFEPRLRSDPKAPLDTAGLLQGLGLLPAAVTLPGLNANRVAASKTGPKVYALLAPGTAIPSNLRGVRVIDHYPDQRSQLLVVDLGAHPGRNLTNFDDHGIVEVREGVVMWRALPSTYAALVPTAPAH